MTNSAAHLQTLKAKARKLAAYLLECSPDDLEFDGGAFTVRGTESSKTIQELAFAAFTGHNLPEGAEARLDSDATFDPENYSFPHGTHLCAVEVDTETGMARIRSYVAVDDVGKVINPLIVRGQVHGGIAQGIAQALFEEAVYDAEGNPLTATFLGYAFPSAAELPSWDVVEMQTPTPLNALGAKGIGESGTIGSTPAVQSAVVDALAPFGVRHVEMPANGERVWRALQQARA